jgi:WD40 repeat protein
MSYISNRLWLLLFIFVLLISCTPSIGTSTGEVTQPAVDTPHIENTSLPEATATQTLTATAAPTSTIRPTIELTETPVNSPTPPPCDAGFLMYADNENILYRACADGSSVQELMSLMPWSHDSLILHFAVLSPDGSKLVDPGRPFTFIDLVSQETYTSFELEGRQGYSVDWSPDGEYIVYARIGDECGVIDVVHVETQTVSNLPVVTDIGTRYIGNDISIDWSPDGKMLSYVFFVAGEGDTSPSINGYIANINCDSTEHTCELLNETRLEWVNSWRTLTWTPDSQSLVTGYTPSPFYSIIEMFNVSDGSLQRIELDLPDELEIVDYYKAEMSPDGNRIAFFAVGNGIYLHVLDMRTMAITEIAYDVNPATVVWLPE